MEDTLHKKQDRQSYLVHEVIFNDVERRQEIMRKAAEVAHRWIVMHSDGERVPSPYWSSWAEKISKLPFDELRQFALSQTDDSIAHRQSSPFSTCLSPEQIKQVKETVKNEFRRS